MLNKNTTGSNMLTPKSTTAP